MLLNEPQAPNQPLNQIVDQFQFEGEPKTDDAAVALVVQDTKRAETFLQSRLWISEWRVAKGLYEAPVRTENWRNTAVPRAANAFPLVAQHVRAILDATMPALFSDWPPFEIAPNEGTSWQVARAWKGVVSYQSRQVKLRDEMRLIVKDTLVFGTGIGKWGWETFDRKRIVYKRAVQPKRVQPLTPGGPVIMQDTPESDALDEIETTEKVCRPFFHRVEVNHLLVDPALRTPDVRDATYVVHRLFLTIRDLNKLRDYEGWMIPSEADLRKLAAPPVETPDATPLEAEGTTYPTQGHRPLPRYIDSSEDPLDHKLEVLERWSNESVIVVLQRKKIIRNEKNPFGCIPFVSGFWDDIPGCFYAFGVPRRIGGIQTHIQGLRNTRLDDIHLNLMNMWMVKKGTEIAAEPIKAYPGGVFKVDDIEKSMTPVKKQPVMNEAYKEEDTLIADAAKTTGANEMLVQGAASSGARSTGMRSSAGAQAVSAAASSRIQGFVDVIANQCLTPILSAFIQMDRRQLDPKTIRKVLGRTLWNELNNSHEAVGEEDTGDLLVDMTNNEDLEVTVLAGSNIASKKNLGATLPVLMQMVQNPGFAQGIQSAGYEVNWLELGRRMEQVSDWQASEDIFIPINPQKVAQQAAQSKPVLDAQATKARLDQMHQQKTELEQQKHNNNLESINAKGMAGLGEKVLEKALERSQVREETPEMAGIGGV